MDKGLIVLRLVDSGRKSCPLNIVNQPLEFHDLNNWKMSSQALEQLIV